MTVLLINGLRAPPDRLEPMKAGLARRGLQHVRTIDLPNDGRTSIAQLGALLAREVGEEQVDIIGFSMGALVARWYIQRGGGKGYVRRFVSIAGPHHGTVSAYTLPFAGVQEMRPGSTLLEDLARDKDPFGAVEVHCLYTPYDMIIVPSKSSILAGAHSVRKFSVPSHRHLVHDRAVFDHVVALLNDPGALSPKSVPIPATPTTLE